SELDLTDARAVDRFFKSVRPQYVFLAAGLTGGIVANRTYPADFMHVNISIQDNLFQSALKYDARRLVFYGSSCMYPRECSQPIKEDALFSGPIEETSEAYATAKLAGVVACRGYNAQYGGGRFIALVPNSIYGPHDNFDAESSHVLSALIRRFHQAHIEDSPSVTLWGSGEPRREFVFSRDAARASIFAAMEAKLENRHYNVGTGTDCSIKELAAQIAGVVGFKGTILWDRTKLDGTPRKLLDSTDFRELGWEPRTGFEEGIRQTYDWFLTNEMDRSA
ncbi:MAG: GDP-L-fucose synthase family protein, partial [Thermodesulfobacteriota bacterium]